MTPLREPPPSPFPTVLESPPSAVVPSTHRGSLDPPGPSSSVSVPVCRLCQVVWFGDRDPWPSLDEGSRNEGRSPLTTEPVLSQEQRLHRSPYPFTRRPVKPREDLDGGSLDTCCSRTIKGFLCGSDTGSLPLPTTIVCRRVRHKSSLGPRSCLPLQ